MKTETLADKIRSLREPIKNDKASGEYRILECLEKEFKESIQKLKEELPKEAYKGIWTYEIWNTIDNIFGDLTNKTFINKTKHIEVSCVKCGFPKGFHPHKNIFIRQEGHTSITSTCKKFKEKKK